MTKRIGAYALTIVFAMATMVSLTGCNTATAAAVVSTIETQLPAALALASKLVSESNGNPEVAAVLQTAAAAVQTNAAVLDAAIAAWKASPTALNLQKVAAVISSVASSINEQVLAANKVTNGTTQTEVLLGLTGLAAIFNGFVIALNSTGKAVASTTASNMTVPYDQVAALIPRWQKQQVAASWDVTLEQAGL